MKNVSYEFQRRVSEGALLRPRAIITFADGTKINLTDDDFRVSGNFITEGAGESKFPLGSAVGKTLSIVIDNTEGQFSEYDFYYSRIQLYTYLLLDDGTTESINEGIFTVTTPETPGTSISIDAVDDMYKADEEYTSELSYPSSLLDIFREALLKSNMTGNTVFNNSDYLVQQAPTGLTIRQVYGLIAQIAGGNAVCDGYGQVNIKTYNAAAFEETGIIDGGYSGTAVNDTINGGGFTDRITDIIDSGTLSGAAGTTIHNLFNFTTIKKGTDEVEITGISATVSRDGAEETILEGSEGYTIGITNALITGNEADALKRIGNAIIGIRIRPFSGEHIAYPLAEFMDPCYIWDTDMNMHQSFITDITFNYLGKTSFSNSTEDPLRNKSIYFSNASEAYRKAREGAEQQRSAWEKAVEDLEEKLESSSGLYSTSVKQEDGSTIFYMHNKPTLAESLVVWKMTSDAIGVSTDGGNTWNAGLSVDGELIARILNAIGINAEWVFTGLLQDQQKKNFWNMNTGQFRLSMDSATFDDVSASEYINTATDKARTLIVSLSNEFHSVPADTNGENGNYSGCETSVSVFWGDADVTAKAAYTLSYSTGITGSWSEANRKFTVTNMTTDTGYVDITANYVGLSATRRFSISKTKSARSISSTLIEYQSSDSGTEIPAGEWQTEIPDLSSGQFLWTRITTSYTDDTEKIAYNIGGVGDDGRGIAYTEIGYQKSSSGTVAPTGEWLTTIPPVGASEFLWTRTILSYSDGSEPTTSYSVGMMGDQGEDARVYILEPSVATITKGLDDKLTPENIAFASYYRDGQSATRTAYSGRFVIEESGDGINWTAKYTSNLDEEVKSYSPSSDTSIIRCTLYASGGTEDALDRQTVSVLTDISNLTQEITFNKLTDNGRLQGIYMEDGELYINFSFARGGVLTLGGLNDTNGVLQVKDSSGNTTTTLDKDGLTTSKASITGGKINITASGGGGAANVISMESSLYKTTMNAGYFGLGSLSGLDGLKVYPTTLTMGNVSNPYFTVSSSLLKHSGSVIINGSLFVDGTKDRKVRTANYGERLQYCYETSTPFFGDIGSGKTDDDGICFINIDDIFQETVSCECCYHVFLQKEGEGDIWVEEKSPCFFVVKGTPGLAFSWELKARQRDYEYERMETFSQDDYEFTDYASLGEQFLISYYREMEEIKHG